VAPTPQSVRLSADTLFDFDQSRLKPSGETALRGLFDKSRGATIEQVRVEGHTDATGPKAYNQRLSERRADAVKDFLVGLGLSPALIVTEPFGEEKPIASNRTREGRAQNRRVEVELLGSRLSK
jgi:OOP family OmpA-OmpF porin